MKKITLLTVLILATLFLLTACGGGDPDDGVVTGNPAGGCAHTWALRDEPTEETPGTIACTLCGYETDHFPVLGDSRLGVTHGEDETVYTYTMQNGTVISYTKSHFTFDENATGYTLRSYSGNKANVVVPATYNGRSVTEVGMSYGEVVFDSATIESITFLETITTFHYDFIGEGCTSLTSLTMPSVEGCSVQGCFKSRVPTVEEVTVLGDTVSYGFFSQCASLKAVYLPATLRTVLQNAFEECEALEDVYFAGTLAEYCLIDFFALDGYDGTPLLYADTLYYKDEGGNYCAVGETLVIPDGVSEIKPTAFTFLGIKTLILPDSVVTIGEKAFRRCSDLTTVVLGTGLATVGKNAFYDASSLEIVYYKGTAAQYGRIVIDSSNSSGNYYLREAERYYYSEEGDLFAFVKGEDFWHFDEDGMPTLWNFTLTDTVGGKTFCHESTAVDISDEYWYMLEMAEAQGMLEAVLEGKQLFFYQNSETKDEFEAKVQEDLNTENAALTVAFADGSITSALYPLPVSYVEVAGAEIYDTAKEEVLFTIEDGKLILDNSNEYITVIITLTVE